ncbi:hypothetical protein ACFLWU_05505 [Chloroflexota bacterium]
MDEHKRTYSCHQCNNVFKLSLPDNAAPEIEVKCPGCGSADTDMLTSWVPIGFTSQGGTHMWEYECQQCKNVFHLPVPTSPSQEKQVKCPGCESWHLHRLTPTGFQPLYCG